METWCKRMSNCYAENNEHGATHVIRDITYNFAVDLSSNEIKMMLSYFLGKHEGLFILIDQVKLMSNWKNFLLESLDLVRELTKKYVTEMDNHIAAVVRLSSYNYSAAALKKKAMNCLLEVTRGLGRAEHLAHVPRFLEEMANLGNTGPQYSSSVKEIAFIIIGEMSINYPELIEQYKIGLWRCFQQVLEKANNPVGLLKGAIIGINGFLTHFTSAVSEPNLGLIFSEWILGNYLDNDLLIESILGLLTNYANLWKPYIINFYGTRPDRFDRLWQIYTELDSKRKISVVAIKTVYEVIAKSMESCDNDGLSEQIKLDLKRRIWDNLSETKPYYHRKQSLQLLADLKNYRHQLMDSETIKAVLHFLEQWIEKTVFEFEDYDMWNMGNADVVNGEHQHFDEEIFKTMESASLLVEVSSLLVDFKPDTLLRHLVSHQHCCPMARKRRVLVKPILTVNAQFRQMIVVRLINNSCDIVRDSNMENTYLNLWKELFRIESEDYEWATPTCLSETFRMFLEATVNRLEILNCSEVYEIDSDTENKPEHETFEFVANVCHLITEIINFDTIDESLFENNLHILKTLMNKCLYLDETVFKYGDPTCCASGICGLIGLLTRVLLKADCEYFLKSEILDRIKNFYMNLTNVKRYKTEVIFANATTLLMIPPQILTNQNNLQIVEALRILLNYPKKDYRILLKVFANIDKMIENVNLDKNIKKKLNSLKLEFLTMNKQIVEHNNDWSKDFNIGLGFNFNQWQSCSESLKISIPCPGRGNLNIHLDEMSRYMIKHGDVATLQSIALLLCCAVQNSDTNIEPILVSRTTRIVRELARRGNELAARISRWMISEDGTRRELYIQCMMKYINKEIDPLTIEVCAESLTVCCRHRPQCLNLILQSLYIFNDDSITDTQSKIIIIKIITPTLAENEDMFKNHALKLLQYIATAQKSIQSNEAFDVLTHKMTEKRAIFEKHSLLTTLFKLTTFTFKNISAADNYNFLKKVISFGKKIMKDEKLETWIDFTLAINILQFKVKNLSEEFKKYVATFDEDKFITVCEMLGIILRLQSVLSKILQDRDEYVHIFSSFNTGVCMNIILSLIVNVSSCRNVKINTFNYIYAFLEVNSELLMAKWISGSSWILMNLLYRHSTLHMATSQITMIKKCFLRYKDIWAENSETWLQFETKFKSQHYELIENLKSVVKELHNAVKINNYQLREEIVDSVRRLIFFDECISLFTVQESLYEAETQEMSDASIDKSFRECVTTIATEETIKWFDILCSTEYAPNEIMLGETGQFVKDVVCLALKVNGQALLMKIMSVGIDNEELFNERRFVSTFNIEIADWVLNNGRNVLIEALECGVGDKVLCLVDVLLKYSMTRDALQEHWKMVLDAVCQKWPVIASSESKISTQIELLKLVAHISQDISYEPGNEPLTWILKQISSDTTSSVVKFQLVEMLQTFLMRKADHEDISDDLKNAMRSYSMQVSMRAIKTLMKACATSGNRLLVETLVQIVIVYSNNGCNDAALISGMRCLGACNSAAMNALRVFCDATLGNQDAQARLIVLERLCSPLLLWSSPQCCERLFMEIWQHLDKVLMFKPKPGFILNGSEYRINMLFVNYISAYTILELLIAKLPRESLMLATSSLSLLVVPQNKSNWALPKRICALCSTWRKIGEAPSTTAGPETKETYRKFRCAVYRCFAAAICRMQPALKFYDRQFSKEVWPLIVGDGNTYIPKDFFGRRSLPRTVAVSTASTSKRAQGSSSVLTTTYLSQANSGSLRRRLFFQTLSDDVFQYDFLNLEVKDDGGNSRESHAPLSVKLDHSEGWNQHECMAVLVSMIEDMASRTNIDASSETDDRVWLENLVNGLNNDRLLTAPRRFLAQVISNCRVMLKKFAHVLRIPLVRATLHSKATPSSTLDSVDLDMFKTLVEWSDTVPSESEMCPEEKELIQTAAHLLVQSASQGSATQAVTIFQQLAPKWKLNTLAPITALLQLLQSVTLKKTGLAVCISLLPYLPISRSRELRSNLMELVKSTQCKLGAEALGAWFGGERKRGVSSSALTHNVEEVMRGTDAERINLLFNIQKHCPDICSRNHFNLAISMTPKVPLPVKKNCLRIIATHLGSASSEPLLLEDISALMLILNPAEMLKEGTGVLVIYVLEIVKNILRFPVNGWEIHVEAVCNLVSKIDQKGSEEIKKVGYEVIVAAFDCIMGIERYEPTEKTSQIWLLANFTEQNAFARRLASILVKGLMDEEIDIADFVFSSLSTRLSSTKFMDLRFVESFLLLILIPLFEITKVNSKNTDELNCRKVVDLMTLTRLVLDACRNSVEYKEAKLRMEPLVLEPDNIARGENTTMLSYTTVHKSVRYIASFSVAGNPSGKRKKTKTRTQIPDKENTNEVYPNVIISLDSVIQPLLNSKDANHSTAALFVSLFESITNQGESDISQKLSPLILQSLSYINQSEIKDTILLHSLLKLFRLCVRYTERSDTTINMFKSLGRKYDGLGLKDLIGLVMEEVEMFGREVDDDIGQPASKKLRIEKPISSQQSYTLLNMPSHAGISQRDTYSISESMKLMDLLADWDSLTKNDKKQHMDLMPNIWTTSDQFVTSLDNYFADENQVRSWNAKWDWLRYGHQLLKGNNRHFAQNWLRKSNLTCPEYRLKMMLELSEWEIHYEASSQGVEVNTFNDHILTEATTTDREILIPSAIFLMLRKSLVDNLPCPLKDTATQESNDTSWKLIAQRSREISWIRNALKLGFWKHAGQCIQRNSEFLTKEESLEWFLLRSQCVMQKAFHLGTRDALHTHTLASHMTLAISSLKDLSEFSPSEIVLEMKSLITHLVAEFGMATVDRAENLDGLSDHILEILGELPSANISQNYVEWSLNTLRITCHVSSEQSKSAMSGQVEAHRRLLHYFDAVLENDDLENIDLQQLLTIELVRTVVSCIKHSGDCVPVIAIMLNRIRQSHVSWDNAIRLFNEEILTVPISALLPAWPYLLPCIPNIPHAVAKICTRIAEVVPALVSQEYRSWRRDSIPDVILINGSVCENLVKTLDALLLNGAGKLVLPDQALIDVCNPLSVLNHFCHQLHQYALHDTQAQKGEEFWKQIMLDIERDLFQGNTKKGSAFQLLDEYQQKLQLIPSYGSPNFQAVAIKVLFSIIQKLEKQLVADCTNTMALNSLSPILAEYKGDGNVPEQLSQFLNGMNGVTIVGFLQEVHIMRGAKCQPVVLSARLSNGRVLRIMLKRAEWRQDHLVQYTQTVMNQMLTSSSTRESRNMVQKIQTYKVVPLRQDVVAIEWLDGSCTLRQLASHGIDLDKIREELADIPDEALVEMSRVAAINRYHSAAAKLHKYHIRSAIERTSSSVEDFIKHKKTFVRSLAVMSIVHWILGVGDRHLSNFLYNVSQGWVCGVDSERTLGSAVSHQRSPELVPARLTPQLCAITHHAGFRIIMEDTLSVFRVGWRELFACISLLCVTPTLDQNLHIQLSCLKKKLNGQLNSFEATMEELERNKLINTALYNRFLEYVKPVYESGRPYTVAEQVDAVLLQCTSPEILAITRNGLEPWV